MGKVIPFKGCKGGTSMSIHCTDVAKAFLSFKPLTHKQLQKLCYYAQAWSLVLFDKPLMNVDFEAWIHGPVCPELYKYYQGYGYEEIPQESHMPKSIENNAEICELIRQVFRIYGHLDGDQLEELTHSERPWQLARGNKKPWEPSNEVIDPNIMKEYYMAELRDDMDV